MITLSIIAVFMIFAICLATERPPSESASIVNVPGCGQQKVAGTFPWVVAVVICDNSERGKSDVCAGALVSQSFVITAGDCHRPRATLSVMYGHEKLSMISGVKDMYMTQYLATEISYMPDNEILLLLLESPIYQVTPICLNAKPFKLSKMEVEAAGWSDKFTASLGQPKSTILHLIKGFVPEELAICKSFFRVDAGHNVCLIYRDPAHKEFICKGDLGAPLMIQQNGIYSLVGFKAYRKLVLSRKCISSYKPIVFVKFHQAHIDLLTQKASELYAFNESA
ncbi:serine protease-like [Tropilaelaps mercedesae]|uniref:Serine protease-like n=1 Tax=Tropilaelaps mercedesae TaxID=418985 RepID=A0A1V9XVJ4_9ACAR|nr:serine protease-like [Tropilaelaps mercedesae]